MSYDVHIDDFISDLSDFIHVRLEKSHKELEETEEYKQKHERCIKLHNQLEEFLKQSENSKLDVFTSFMEAIEDINEIYDISTYKRGFVDAINMIYSTNNPILDK